MMSDTAVGARSRRSWGLQIAQVLLGLIIGLFGTNLLVRLGTADKLILVASAACGLAVSWRSRAWRVMGMAWVAGVVLYAGFVYYLLFTFYS